MNYHKCTDEDYAEFYPVQKSSENFLKKIREDPDRGLFCIDWTDKVPFELVGTLNDSTYARFAAVLVPCNYIHSRYGYTGDKIVPECNGDLEE